jgi:hypothetical protein
MSMKSTTKRWIFMIVLSCVACSTAPAPTTFRRGTAAVGGGLVASNVAGTAAPTAESQASSGPNANPTTIAMLAPMDARPDGHCNQDVDVVFVLDVSGSMTPELTKLSAEVGMVDAALQTKNLPSPAHYGLVLFVDDVVVMNSGNPYPTIDALKAEVDNQATMTSGNSGREVMGDPLNFTWPENGLDALYAAATQYKWRPTATTLRIIFLITDASFWDGANPSSGADSEAPNPLVDHKSMHSYMETINALRMNQIWGNTFAAKTGGPPDGMTAPASHGQFRGISVDVGKGFFEPYMGQKSIPDATGGSAWDVDDVYDGKISLGTPIQMSIEARQCAMYPQ